MLKKTRVNSTVSYYPGELPYKCFMVATEQLGAVVVLGGKVQFIGF